MLQFAVDCDSARNVVEKIEMQIEAVWCIMLLAVQACQHRLTLLT